MSSSRYDRLLKRRIPEADRKAESIVEGYERQLGESTKYILGAIREVDSAYTRKLVEQGDRVESQLDKKIRTNYPKIEYRRQGSVSNNTHIKYSSDVDLLVIIDKYIALEAPQKPQILYSGNPGQDLLNLRSECKQILDAAFPVAKIDDSGSTALCLSGGSLFCPVDVVPSNWLNTVAYAQSREEYDRGIEVYNRDRQLRTSNYPFKFNKRIDEKDRLHNGRVRMMIRLIKTLKSDLEEEGVKVNLSSFDICSIIYQAPNSIFLPAINKPFEIAEKCAFWMELSARESALSSTLKVVDDSRIIYDNDDKNKASVILSKELTNVISSAKKEHQGIEYITEAHYKG